MRTLRWAAELAVSDDDAKSALGVSQLTALGESELLDEAQQLFVGAAVNAVLEDAVEEVERAGDDAEVLRQVETRLLGQAEENDVALPIQVKVEEQDG